VDIVLEEYLIQESKFKNRQPIAKFRTSDHCLQIETGRYNNIPRQQRLCTEKLQINEQIKLYTIYTNTVDRQMELAGRTKLSYLFI
jgi:hypothetical protein